MNLAFRHCITLRQKKKKNLAQVQLGDMLLVFSSVANNLMDSLIFLKKSVITFS